MALKLQDTYIVVVEDNVLNRVVFQTALLRAGARVEFEKEGPGILQRLSNAHKIDLVLLDLMLPNGVSGLDLFEGIRKHPQGSDVPVVAVTAMEPAIALPLVKAKGMNGFIAKPIDAFTLPDVLLRVLAGETVYALGDAEMRP